MLRFAPHTLGLAAVLAGTALVALTVPIPSAAGLHADPVAATASATRAVARAHGPGRFMARLVVQKAIGRHEAAWRTLHPFHKGVAARDEYVACESLTPFPGLITSIRVLKVFDDPVLVAGMTAPVPSKAVIVRAAVWTAIRPVVVTHTFHAVAVNGRWTWILTPERFEAYAADACARSALRH